jgi:hypothetical protein
VKKTIFLHIGPPKTGTSAIQQFLSANRKILKENGYLYPGRGLAHHDMAREFHSLTVTDIRNNPALATNNYFAEIDASGLDKIILSSENFNGLMQQRENLKKEIASLKEFLIPRFQVNIIFYVRRQDEKIESMYNETVRGYRKRTDESFSEFIKKTTQHGPDDAKTDTLFRALECYSHLLEWSNAFGRENILVRCNEDEQLPQGIYHDFLETIGLTLDGRYWIPENRVHESLGWDLTEIMRICNTHFKGDIDFHTFLLENFIKINSGNDQRKRHRLSPQQRRDLIESFEESNAKIAREFLGRKDGRLFYAPLPDLQEPWEPCTGLTVEKIVPVFAQLMYNIDKRNRDQNKTLSQKYLKQTARHYLGSFKTGLLSIFSGEAE